MGPFELGENSDVFKAINKFYNAAYYESRRNFIYFKSTYEHFNKY